MSGMEKVAMEKGDDEKKCVGVMAPDLYLCPLSGRLMLDVGCCTVDGVLGDRTALIKRYGAGNVVKVPSFSSLVDKWIKSHHVLTEDQFADALKRGDVATLNVHPFIKQWVSEGVLLEGCSFMKFATFTCQPESVKWLLERGCPVTSSVLHDAVAAPWMSGSSAHDAKIMGTHTSIITSLLQKFHDVPTDPQVGIAAIKAGCIDVVRSLHAAKFPFQNGVLMHCPTVEMAEYLLQECHLTIGKDSVGGNGSKSGCVVHDMETCFGTRCILGHKFVIDATHFNCEFSGLCDRVRQLFAHCSTQVHFSKKSMLIFRRLGKGQNGNVIVGIDTIFF